MRTHLGIQYLDWKDLTEIEKNMAIEQYITIREDEEEMSREEIYIDPSGVESCSFLREGQSIFVNI